MAYNRISRQPAPRGHLSKGVMDSCDGSGRAVLTPAIWDQILFDLDAATHSEISHAAAHAKMREHPDEICISLLDFVNHTEAGGQQRFAGCCGMLPFRADTFLPLPRRHEGREVTFRLASTLCYLDGPLGRQVEIDFADGGGMRTIEFDMPVKISYSRAGSYAIQVKWTGQHGSAMARFLIEISDPLLAAPQPDDTWSLNASYKGVNYSGTATVWYGQGQTAVDAAVVFCQPFADLSAAEIYDLFNILGAADKIRSSTPGPARSLVIVTFAGYTSSIQANAMVVVDCLQQLTKKSSAGGHVLGGVSMGALIMRYALTYWEFNNLQPILANATVYFSWDGPHFCACIPISVQWQMLYWAPLNVDAQNLVTLLHSPAALQMLFFNVSDVNGGSVQNQAFEDFWNDIWAMNGYPQNVNLTKVAVANGAGAGGQLLTPGLLNVSVVGKLSSGAVAATCYASNDPADSQSAVIVAKGLACTKLPLMTMVASSIIPFTDAQGGLRDSFQQLGDKVAAGMSNQPPIAGVDETVVAGNHCFVPTFSALDMPNVNDPFQPLNNQVSNFNQYMFSSTNTGHAVVTQELQDWLLMTVFGFKSAEETRHTQNQSFGRFPRHKQLISIKDDGGR